jgi:hypothetical protein
MSKIVIYFGPCLVGCFKQQCGCQEHQTSSLGTSMDTFMPFLFNYFHLYFFHELAFIE